MQIHVVLLIMRLLIWNHRSFFQKRILSNQISKIRLLFSWTVFSIVSLRKIFKKKNQSFEKNKWIWVWVLILTQNSQIFWVFSDSHSFLKTWVRLNSKLKLFEQTHEFWFIDFKLAQHWWRLTFAAEAILIDQTLFNCYTVDLSSFWINKKLNLKLRGEKEQYCWHTSFWNRQSSSNWKCDLSLH